MKVAISQSNFLPWRSTFDMISDVDLFVLFDDVAYTSRSWRNRNKIKGPNGLSWITVPVERHSPRLSIDVTNIDYSHDWRQRIKQQL